MFGGIANCDPLECRQANSIQTTRRSDVNSRAVAGTEPSAINRGFSIEGYHIPWSASLKSWLGDVSFRFEGLHADPPHVRWLGIVSSHRSKWDYANECWQRSLQSAIRLAIQQRWGLLFASDTPYASIVANAAQRYHLPSIVVETNACDRNDSSETFGNAVRLQLLKTSSQPESDVPLHDQAVVCLSHFVFALSVRSGGKMESLLKRRLQSADIPEGTTYVACHQGTSRPGAPEPSLLQCGAVGWVHTRDSNVISAVSDRLANADAVIPRCRTLASECGVFTVQPTMPLEKLMQSDRFLIHCTRARRGPWPDQSLEQFHDELLCHGWSGSPQPIETLCRILDQQRLFASRLGRQGFRETVCFSEARIETLLAMRRFQSHLGRWDWEPYGIMIDREWLAAAGARPVTYVDRHQAKKMNPEELTFSHVVSNASNSQDWRREKEWRLLGDLRLQTVPFHKAIIFVSNSEEAKIVSGRSRWPIAIVNPR
jgi:hypothetical protein